MANRLSSPMNSVRRTITTQFVIVAAALAAALSQSELPSCAQSGNASSINGYYVPEPGPYSYVPSENPGSPRPLSREEMKDPAVKAHIEASQAVLRAMAEFRGAQGDAAKAAAQKKLNDALIKCFDADMKVREEKLQKVEAQVKTLRTQFDKRASKKQEILDLQMKMYENEAEGLGFFGNSLGGGMFSPEAAVVSTLWQTPWGAPPPSSVPAPTFSSNAPGMAPGRANSPQPRTLDAPSQRPREAPANSPTPAE